MCGFNFDVSKAFDKDWHTGIIYNVILLRIPNYMVSFTRSFLTGRSFSV